MTRFPRLDAPGLVHHVIARFVNRAFRMQGREERCEYLRRLAKQLAKVDWRLLGYALMSSHIHLVLRAGTAPSSRLVGPLHTGFALWLNRRQSGLGPVFASRHTTIAVEDERGAALLAYVHNNPVRAGVVAGARDSAWTSHRAYVGLAVAPPWLHVDEGLALAGFSGETAQEGFDAFVAARAGDGREPEWSAEPKRELHAARRGAGAPVRVSWPHISDEGRQVVIERAGGMRPRWPGRPEPVATLAARHMGVSPADLVGTNRTTEVVQARRVALLTWTEGLGRTQLEMACHLGLSSGGASQLVRARPELIEPARREASWIASMCWEEIVE